MTMVATLISSLICGTAGYLAGSMMNAVKCADEVEDRHLFWCHWAIATGPEPIGHPLLVGYFDDMKSCIAAANQLCWLAADAELNPYLYAS
jgi:hypothetical protein